MGEGTPRGPNDLLDKHTEELTRRLFERTVALVSASDPPLAEILELCAIPEAFNAEMIGIVRNRPEDDETNRRLFDSIRGYPFVESYDDETCGYHDILRPGLREKLWRERRGEVERINAQLGALYLERGRSTYRRGNLSRALLYFRRAIETDSAVLAQAYHWRGRTHVKLAQFEDALADFSAAIQLGPQDSENYFRKASALIELERFREAIEDLDRAIALEPGRYPKNYYARGMAYYRLGENEPALADFNRAVATIAQLPEELGTHEDRQERARLDEILEGRGIVYLELRRYEEALRDFEQARQLNPQSSSHRFWCGLAHYYRQAYQPAVEHFSAAIELNGINDLIYRWRGVAFTHLFNYGEARRDFLRALEIDPTSINHYWLGFAQFHLKEHHAALASFNQAIRQAPAFYPAYRWRGTLSYGLGAYQEARADFDKAVIGLPRNAKIYQERGAYIFLDALDDLAQAEADFAQALALSTPASPDHSTILFWRSQTNIDRGAFQLALADLHQALEYQPGRSRNLFWRGVVSDQLGDTAAAEQDWAQTQALAEAEPKQWPRSTRLAWLAVLRGSPDEARAHYTHAFSDSANYFLHDLRYQLANLRRLSRVYPARGDIAAFVEWYTQEMARHIPAYGI